jgi:hypothetical protein
MLCCPLEHLVPVHADAQLGCLQKPGGVCQAFCCASAEPTGRLQEVGAQFPAEWWLPSACFIAAAMPCSPGNVHC